VAAGPAVHDTPGEHTLETELTEAIPDGMAAGSGGTRSVVLPFSDKDKKVNMGENIRQWA
jgi:hypothetical protein